MKIRKYIMVLGLLTLFLSVGYADGNVTIESSLSTPDPKDPSLSDEEMKEMIEMTGLTVEELLSTFNQANNNVSESDLTDDPKMVEALAALDSLEEVYLEGAEIESNLNVAREEHRKAREAVAAH